MSHPWMYGNRRASAFREGVHSFLAVAEANKRRDGFMCCPCVECRNEKDYTSSRVIQSHLLATKPGTTDADFRARLRDLGHSVRC